MKAANKMAARIETRITDLAVAVTFMVLVALLVGCLTGYR